MENFVSVSINSICKIHQTKFIAICTNKECNKQGFVCYMCIYTKHLSHVSSCIPIEYWKMESNILNNSNTIDKLYEIETEIKSINNSIENYFVRLYERIYIEKHNIKINGVVGFTSNYLNIWENYKKVGEEYIISSNELDNMINNMEKTFVRDLQKYINKELKNIKINNNINRDRQIKKSNSRFSEFKDNWSHMLSYYDCIAFRINEDVTLVGLGLYQSIEKKGIIEISIFHTCIQDDFLIYREKVDFLEREIEYDNRLKFGDLIFSSEIQLNVSKLYIIVKSNLENNPNGYYGIKANKETAPFEFIDYLEQSQMYKSGNHTKISCGAYPYFIYK